MGCEYLYFQLIVAITREVEMDVMPKHFTIQPYKATGNVFYTLRITPLAVFPQKLASVAFLPDFLFLLLTHYPSSDLNGIPLSRRHTSSRRLS